MPAMLLGEMLLKAGALTQVQLEQVLSAQSIYGGKLGTNLVEMGLIGEEQLARVLNEKLGVPFVDAALLDGIPEEVLAVVPLEMVQRYHVLPVAKDGKRLTIAMEDPSDFKAIDEIGFVTGLIIVPKVCSELRLNIALERYFGIKRAMRYIPVAGGARTTFRRDVLHEGTEMEAGNPTLYEATDMEAGNPTLYEVTDMEAGNITLHEGVETETSNISLHGRTETEAINVALPKGTETETGRISASKDNEPNDCGMRIKMEVLAERLADAPGEAQVVSALLLYLSGEFDRAAFLRLKCGSALGVQAVSDGNEVHGFSRYAVGLDEVPQLQRVVQERHLYVGEFAAEAAVGELMQAMGGSAPAPALVVPVAVGGQVAGVICVNDQNGRLSGGVFELQRVAAMAELAFEMLRIRKRIRAV